MRRLAVTVVVIVALAGAGCASTAQHHASAPFSAPAAMTLSSSFPAGGIIPRVYTCDGQDISPPLRAAGVPAATVELMVEMRDPDAPGGNFIHWATAHINPRLVVSAGPGSAVLRVGRVPAGAVQGRNSFGTLGYRGPCPPRGGAAHHYRVTLFALGKPSMLTAGFAPSAVGKLDVLALATLTGVYGRS